MSVIVALKDNGRFILASDKQASTGNYTDHKATKIWEVQDLPGAIMGGVGSFRASQIIQYADIVDKNAIVETIDTQFVVCSIAPTIKAILELNGISCHLDKDDESDIMPNAFIFAFRDKAWMIWHDLSVSEITDYQTIGSGSEVATGVMYATTRVKNPFERVVTAIDAAAENTIYVDHGVDLLATGFTAKDDKWAAEALGYEYEEPVPVKKKPAKKKKPTPKKVVEEEPKVEEVEEVKPKSTKKSSNKSKK